ncbi:MAG TPA: XdhC family protein, partial [Actinospica sp.]|nr:XdhC family protein [Actinospica sp.]
QVFEVEHGGGTAKLFVNAYSPLPRLLVFGALSFADELAVLGRFLGYRVTVCDPRPAFATAQRLPAAHEVVVDRPERYLAGEAAAGRLDRRTVLAVLTHDAKFDIPLLALALRLPVGFVGALGSRRSHAERVRRLLALGVPADALDRLSAPIGLDLGAVTPQETAVSIVAEIIARVRGGSGAPLRGLGGPIHTRPDAAAAAGRDPVPHRPLVRAGRPVPDLQ